MATVIAENDKKLFLFKKSRRAKDAIDDLPSQSCTASRSSGEGCRSKSRKATESSGSSYHEHGRGRGESEGVHFSKAEEMIQGLFDATREEHYEEWKAK